MTGLVPLMVKRAYWSLARRDGAFLEEIRDRFRIREIDLDRSLIWGSIHWAEVLGDLRWASTLLRDSPPVQFLETYRRAGDQIFASENIAKTAYYRNAEQYLRCTGEYFGYRTCEGIRARLRGFVSLYDRIRENDLSEVVFPLRDKHSPPGSLPVVYGTLTKGTVQILDGHHRLAIAWVLGQRRAKAVVLPSRATDLQHLIRTAALTRNRNQVVKELYQPIDGPEVDGSWRLLRCCQEQLEMMVEFLDQRGYDLNGRSVLDMGCRYGWFVNALARRGCRSLGVDWNPAALKVGQIAYGLQREQVVQGDVLEYVRRCQETFDVVLLLSGTQGFIPGAEYLRLEELLQAIDRVTGSVLFLDIAPEGLGANPGDLAGWDEAQVGEFIRRHTSFSEVAAIGKASGRSEGNGAGAKRTLFACARA